jgi:hypothetical protein
VNIWDRLAVAAQIAAVWEQVKGLPVQALASLPAFVVRVGGRRYELGPIPVRRVG